MNFLCSFFGRFATLCLVSFGLGNAVLCCAVLCCAVLCCAVLCCAVLCCAEYSITVAGSAIRHLTRIGVIESDFHKDDRSGIHRNHRKYLYPPQRNEDAPLLLSRLAQDRAYFPEGTCILDHHHATQFITFSPPFEYSSNHDNYNKTTKLDKLDKLDKTTTTTMSLGVRRGHRSSSSSSSSRSNAKTTIQTKNQHEGTSSTRCGRRGCFSRLNCLRNSKGKTRNSNDDDPHRHISMATLTEEEEKRWLAYSMKPIDEDQSLANASVVSMSAPLLR